MPDDPTFESLVAMYADLDERVRTIEQYLAVNDPYDPTDGVYDPDGDYTYNYIHTDD